MKPVVLAAAAVAALILGIAAAAHAVHASAGAAKVVPSSPAAPHPAKNVPCPGGHERLAGPKAVARFRAVTAVSCIDAVRTSAGQGRWEVQIRRVAAGGVAALQRYFEQPDEPQLPKDGVCLQVARVIAVPAFVDGEGHALVPRTPVDGCGEPLEGYGPRMRGVRWHVVDVRMVRELVSAPALAAHCAMSVKDLPAGAIGPLRPGSGGSLFVRRPETVTVCIFRTEDFEAGRFVSGFTLDRARTRRLLGALTGAAPHRGCTNQPRFAVVGARSEEGVWVELGGCFRVAGFDGSHVLGSANATVVRSILGSGR